MERIRVMQVIARMNVGGPAALVAAVHERLDPERFDTRLLTGSVGPGEGDYLATHRPDLHHTRVRGLGREPDVLGDPRALLAIRRELAAFRPHVVHTHTAKAGALGRVATIGARVPATIHTFHGHLLHGYFSPTATRALVAAERLLARRTTRLVAVGEAVRDELLAARVGRPDQYAVVAPGVDIGEPPARHAARAALDLPADAPVVAYVGRLTAVKRPDRFAAAARLVAAEMPDTRFVVAGDGDLLDATRVELATLGEAVRWLGWRTDVDHVYAAADVVVLTSDNEGMPLGLVEAAACATPAVTTPAGAAPEVVEHGRTGLVAGPDPASLASATLTILRDPELRARLGAAAREGALERFAMRRYVDDVAALYEQLHTGARP